MPIATEALTPVLIELLASTGSEITLTDAEVTQLSAAGAAIGQALIDGNFNAVLYAIAALGGVPPSAISAMETIFKGNIAGGARALVPVATEALSPVLNEVVSSLYLAFQRRLSL